MASEAPSSDPWRPSRSTLAAGVLLAMIVAGAVIADVMGDVAAGANLAHVVMEIAVVFGVAAIGIVLGRLLVSELSRTRTAADEMRRDLAFARQDASRWRAEARGLVQGLARAIDDQLQSWQLTAAEREVALMLLKGLSLKEIAAARGTSERTVRQQSLAVYRKSGLAGRAELSAFFLEDLLVR